jgi:predicted  nucleic acid-binding Zn-ribbon protein
MKEEFSKYIGILKKNQIEILEMKSQIMQIKNTIESLSIKMDQNEGKISGFEDVLEHADEGREKNLKSTNGACKTF